MWQHTTLKWLDRAAGVLAALGAVTVVLLTGLIVVQVFWRYVLNAPIFGLEDVVRMALVVVVAGSVAYGARQGAHVHVDVLKMLGGKKLIRFTDVLVKLGGAGIVALLAFALWEEGRCGFRCGDFTDNLNIIHTPFYNTLSLGMGIYALILIVELIGSVVRLGNPEADDGPGKGS